MFSVRRRRGEVDGEEEEEELETDTHHILFDRYLRPLNPIQVSAALRRFVSWRTYARVLSYSAIHGIVSLSASH